MTSPYGPSIDDLSRADLAWRPGCFAGKIVAISGAGSGIGRAAAIILARLGADITICGRREHTLDETATAVMAQGRRVLVLPGSIRDPVFVADFFAKSYAEYGRIDCLVNNAGGQFPQAAIDFSIKGWQAVIDTNLNGPWYMMQQAAQHWRDRATGGAIVNIVAVVDRGMPGVAHTCAARAGIIHLAKTLAIEWAPLDIRVNCIAPGIIATDGMRAYPDAVVATMPQSNLMKRFGDVADVVNAICYLAGDTGKFMTGTVLTVDGGFHLWGDQWTIAEPDYFRAPPKE